jgi:hypothetical protein
VSLLLLAKLAMADSYTNNHSATVIDAPQVVANFLKVDVELLALAFINVRVSPQHSQMEPQGGSHNER